MSSNVQSYSQSGFLYGRLIASPQESTGKSGWFPLSCTAGVNTALLQEVGETGHETGASLTSAYSYACLQHTLTCGLKKLSHECCCMLQLCLSTPPTHTRFPLIRTMAISVTLHFQHIVYYVVQWFLLILHYPFADAATHYPMHAIACNGLRNFNSDPPGTTEIDALKCMVREERWTLLTLQFNGTNYAAV